MSQVFTALKQSTYASHTTLENTYPFSLYQTLESFSLSTYSDVLNVMRSFHAATHDIIDNATPPFIRANEFGRYIDKGKILGALKKDTETLATLFNITPQNPVTLVELPEFNSAITSFISALYVVLGSSMGANIILRRLAKLDDELTSHYYGVMAELSKSWVLFKQQLDRQLPLLNTNNEHFITHLCDDANKWFNYLIALGKALSSNDVINEPA